MGWDSEFFTHKKEVFGNQKEPGGIIAKGENKFRRCSGCNQPIGTVSTTLYEIDEKHYCSECYFRMIVNQAVERDHSDIKLKKEALKQSV
ncbi:MAG: LIM domain-containing protein [Candidatus Bathyarchaeia archaeon]